MTEQEKTTLLQMGRRRCLGLLERIFTEALQKSNFRSAEVWFHEYSGAAKMMEALRLISGEEYESLVKDLDSRYRAAKFPHTYCGKSIGP